MNEVDPKNCTTPLVKISRQRSVRWGKRKSYLPEFKAKVALEAIKGENLASI
jgi:hypothetical protein